MIQFYSGKTKGKNITLKDEASILEFFEKIWKEKDLNKIVKLTLQNETFWGLDLSRLPGFHNQILSELEYLQETHKDSF
jgi:tagaturonate reductase